MNRERGQVLPLMAALLVLCGLGAVALANLGARAADRASAQAAADAAALAGAVAGRGAASQLAVANGGRLESYVVVDGDVRVTVAVGGMVASARARASPGPSPSSVPAPAMRAALARAGQLVGAPVEVDAVGSAGLEVDVSGSMANRLVPIADQAGLCRPDPTRSPRRFALCPPPPSALAGLEGPTVNSTADERPSPVLSVACRKDAGFGGSFGGWTAGRCFGSPSCSASACSRSP